MSDAHSSPSSSPLHALLEQLTRYKQERNVLVNTKTGLAAPRIADVYLAADVEATLTAAPQTPELSKGCSLLAHWWAMGNVAITEAPDDLKRCMCGRVAWADREKLIAVCTGYKVVYTVEREARPLPSERPETTLRTVLELDGPEPAALRVAGFLRHYAGIIRKNERWDTPETMARAYESAARVLEELPSVPPSAPPPPRDWHPIETAPKDGTPFLAFGDAYAELAESPWRIWMTADTEKPRKPWVTIISWHEVWYDKEIDNGDGSYRKERTLSSAHWEPYYYAFKPTHWMPLPSAPDMKNEKT